MKQPESSDQTNNKAHPWRRCPIGQHHVRTHMMHVAPSKEYTNGHYVPRQERCAKNTLRQPDPKSKPVVVDLLSFDELTHISQTYFADLKGAPTANVLTQFEHADKYDLLIRGWVRYWNDVLKFKEPLDPN